MQKKYPLFCDSCLSSCCATVTRFAMQPVERFRPWAHLLAAQLLSALYGAETDGAEAFCEHRFADLARILVGPASVVRFLHEFSSIALRLTKVQPCWLADQVWIVEVQTRFEVFVEDVRHRPNGARDCRVEPRHVFSCENNLADVMRCR
jgi:hypothetical protein